jgi:prolyl-tRNA synthetase
MKYSQLFGKTLKEAPRDEVSLNAQLLTRAGFINKVAAGVYTYLPLGQRVISKISQIVREEMDSAGGQEITMPVLHPKENWEKTGRWEGLDVLFKLKGESGEYALGATHEEIVVPLATHYIFSYNDLPKYVYQIQVKFRDEPRAKSGLMRGREFLMKDLYSFHTNEGDLDKYYEVMKKSYSRVFERLSLDALETEASGGTFAKYSHEYQVICSTGEDTVFYCDGDGCGFSQNKEIAEVKDGDKCKKCAGLGHDGTIHEANAAEVGNIFKLKNKYSEPFALTYVDEKGQKQLVMMGCYGIGISRLMGVIAEIKNDDKGLIWPASVAPFDAHLVHVEDPSTEAWAKEAYEKLTAAGVDVLWDDREDVSAGQKFADADLIGIPVRLVVSRKVGVGKVEWKERGNGKIEVMELEKAIKTLS